MCGRTPRIIPTQDRRRKRDSRGRRPEPCRLFRSAPVRMHLQPSWWIRAVRAAALAGVSVVSIAAAMTAPAGALEIYVANPFDDIRQLVQGLPEAKPAPAGPSDLGRLGAIASWMAGWQGKVKASADRPLIAIFAASHGLAERPGSDARAATRQALDAFAAGT